MLSRLKQVSGPEVRLQGSLYSEEAIVQAPSLDNVTYTIFVVAVHPAETARLRLLAKRLLGGSSGSIPDLTAETSACWIHILLY